MANGFLKLYPEADGVSQVVKELSNEQLTWIPLYNSPRGSIIAVAHLQGKKGAGGNMISTNTVLKCVLILLIALGGFLVPCE